MNQLPVGPGSHVPTSNGMNHPALHETMDREAAAPLGDVQKRYLALDGLRGIAAILVVIYHVRSQFLGYEGCPAGDGYLAVDLFFILSGFVLSHAYLTRFERGMTVFQFLRIRLIRLYPLYFLGLAIGTAVLVAGIDRPEGFGLSSLASAFTLEAFILPGHPTIKGALFPINPVGWSLFYELWVNLLFVATWRFLSKRILTLVVASSGLLLAAWTIRYHGVGGGNMEWNVLGGVVRTIFSFSFGILLYRLKGEGRFNVRVSPPMLAIAIVFTAAYLVFPVDNTVRAFYDLAFVTAVGPALVIAGTVCKLDRAPLAVMSFLGSMSYALYAIHDPIAMVSRHFVMQWRMVAVGRDPILYSLIFSAAMVALSFAADIAYDGPVRKFLSGPKSRQNG